MTYKLNDVIERTEEIGRLNRKLFEEHGEASQLQCAEYHEQLAEWLRELKGYRRKAGRPKNLYMRMESFYKHGMLDFEEKEKLQSGLRSIEEWEKLKRCCEDMISEHVGGLYVKDEKVEFHIYRKGQE